MDISVLTSKYQCLCKSELEVFKATSPPPPTFKGPLGQSSVKIIPLAFPFAVPTSTPTSHALSPWGKSPQVQVSFLADLSNEFVVGRILRKNCQIKEKELICPLDRASFCLTATSPQGSQTFLLSTLSFIRHHWGKNSHPAFPLLSVPLTCSFSNCQ